MHPDRRLLLVPVLIWAAMLQAQSLRSPEVHRDGTVTFRLTAPSAHKVEVNLELKSGTTVLPMTRDRDGVWSASSDRLQPDLYSYSMTVDGLTIIDPAVHRFVPNLFDQGGLFIVPGSAPEPWEETDVPHGQIHRRLYLSKTLGEQREVYVYTPPSFDHTGKTQYPVLYLLHGYSDTADAWTVMGRANLILDNLIAQGKAKPMMLVMPLGYGAPKLLESGWHIEHNALWQTNVDRFTDLLLSEIIPMVEDDYPVQKDRLGRAVAGLSMGGAESLHTGLNHLDKFAWVGSMSAALFQDPATEFPQLTRQAQQLKLLWVACGKEDHLIKNNREFLAWLKSRNIEVQSVETDGAHTWPVWRRNLIQLAPLLFR
jgi:enterochelin esterase family protein